MASEYPAVEVSARKRIDALDPVELARRRAALERSLDEAGGPSPAAERLAALDERIADARIRLEAIATEPAAAPDDRAAARSASLERQGENQLARLEAERPALADTVAAEPPPRSKASAERLELRLVEEWLVSLRRQLVAEERLDAKGPVLEALGPYPTDLGRRRAWAEGADLIVGYRLRHGITSPDDDPLGSRSGDAARRRERQAVEQRLAGVLQRLERERVVQTAQRTIEMEI